MSLEPLASPCWRSIGIGGDRSCPELSRHIHCRNCPILSLTADRMRERYAPDGYYTAMAGSAALPLGSRERLTSYCLFRLGNDWLALETSCVVEIASMRPIHRVPHRSGPVDGMVNVRGQLLLAVRLGDLLEATPLEKNTTKPAVRRIVVIARGVDTWAFAAEAVEGVLSFSADQKLPPPATLSPAVSAVTRGTLPWKEQRVTLLDSAELFSLIRQRVSQ